MACAGSSLFTCIVVRISICICSKFWNLLPTNPFILQCPEVILASTSPPGPYFPLLWSYLWSPTHAFATFPVVPFLPSPGGVLGNGFTEGIWRVLISLHFVWCSCLMSCCQGDLSIFPLVTFHWTKSWCRQRPLVQGDQAQSQMYPEQSINKYQVETSTKYQQVPSSNKCKVPTIIT